MPYSFANALMVITLLRGTPPEKSASLPERSGGRGEVVLMTEDGAPVEVLELSRGENACLELYFDAAVDPLSVPPELAERLSEVIWSDSSRQAALCPARREKPGALISFSGRFQGDALPRSFYLRLKVVEHQSRRRVKVVRRAPPSEPQQQEAQGEGAGARRDEPRVALARKEGQAPGGLTGLFASGVLGRGLLRPLESRVLSREVLPPELASARLDVLLSDTRLLLILSMEYSMPAPALLDLVGARVVASGGEELTGRELLLQPPAGNQQPPVHTVYVEVERPASERPGSYTLHLWTQGREQTLSIPGIVLPGLASEVR